jgi:osmoprotectant transport system permease protein
MGMPEARVLFQVEVPVALPLILSGLRSAAIQIVSTATIAAYVSFGGLGRYIIDGLYQKDYEKVVGGAGLVAGLALVTLAVFWAASRLTVSPGVRRSG